MKHNRRDNFFKCLAAPVIAFMVQQAVSIIYMEAYMGYKLAVFPGGDYMAYLLKIADDMANPVMLAWISLAYALICTVWFGVWYYRMKYNTPYEAALSPTEVKDRAYDIASRQRGIFEGYSWTIIPGIILLCIGGQVVCNFFSEFLGSLFPSWYDMYNDIMKSMGMDSVENIGFALSLYAFILGPICEELTFRGLCFSYARRSAGFWAANIISALLFGLMHLNPLQSAYAILLGLIFGAIYEKSNNIILSMIIHIAFNLSTLVVSPFMYFGDTAFKFFAILLVSLLVTYVGYETVIRAIPKHIDIEIR